MDNNDLAEAIAVSLYMEAKAAGWTLEGLADELGLSTQTLGRYLTRRTRSIPVDVLTQACAVIGVPVSTVIARAEERVSHPAARPDEVRDTAKKIAQEAREKVTRKGGEVDGTKGEVRNLRAAKRGK